MGKNTNIIHINGKRYDAKTGAVLSVDGFTATPSTALQPIARTMPQSVTKKPIMDGIVRKPAKHATKHLQGSQTLMRHAVAKPAVKKPIKAVSHAHSLHKNPVTVAQKQSVTALDQRRSKRAAHVPKSQAIQKFSAVKPHHNPALLTSAVTPITYKKPTQAVAKQQTTADLLQQALETATSHQQTYSQPLSRFGVRRVAATVVASVAVVAIIAVAGLHGATAVKLHMASSKAGFSVAMPAYQPAGFSLKDLNSTTGNASLKFASNTDERAFSVIEKASQWDSGTLRDMAVAPLGSKYQTIESAGRTIYVDDNHTANWVNGGIWYQVKNENALSDHQLVQIANSL